MKFGGFVATDSIDDATEYARSLERWGWNALWAIDSQQLYTDLYVTLTACATVTDELTLAPGITNPKSRHPSVTANAVASLDQFSEGRAVLGVGAGDSAVYSVGKRPASVDELAESAEKMRRLLRGEEVTLGGEPFQLESRQRDVDVYVAAEGPKTLRAAGEVADGVIFGGGPNPETVAELGLANVRRGAEHAGRSLDELDIVTLTPTCVAESRADAVEKLKPVIEPIAYHNFSFSVEEAPNDVQADLRALVDAHDMQEHGDEEADALDEINDEVWEYLGDRFAVAGPPPACRERLWALEELGVDHVMCLFPPDRRTETERFHDRVLADTALAP
ncbi:LLM class flavin-dependent oxidoreductase [Haloterrigena alkaliphila]|uniref:LLM class flavin-dependent oxidoreductase n=1 Tax=Haloterrigena alkaliphila TaxID=2816475 RepID=UPI001CFFE091|nr:LLM class flavin-dependent oxidoreductase [Haloterrigena alkaliphila]UHQ95208.1 LLM class flavin-dependent oxidoreductase [Haloterrigena alkaliphila]